MTVDEEVCVRWRLIQQSTPEGEQFRDVFLLGRNHIGIAHIDDVVEAKLELCMLAKGVECLGHWPLRV